MAEDLGAEGGLQGAGSSGHVGPLVPDVDEGDEDPQAQRGVAVQEVLGQDGGGLVGADPLEHGGNDAPAAAVAPRVGEGPRGGRSAAPPAATRASAASPASAGRPSRARRASANGSAPCRATARIAARATSCPRPRRAGERVREGQGRRSASRAASRRVLRPASPGSATIDSKSGRAASSRSSPRRASTATTAARTEKSG